MDAEYIALREAAEVVANFYDGRDMVFFHTDCQPLVRKLKKAESEKWSDRSDELGKILKGSPEWTIRWVPRSRNESADSLAHTAMDEGKA